MAYRGRDPAAYGRLWATLCETYGSDVMERRFGGEPNPTWIAKLDRLEPDQITTAVVRLGDVHPSRPPTALEFETLARGGGNAQQRAFAAQCAAQAQADLLPSPESLAIRGGPAGGHWAAYWESFGVRPQIRDGDTLDRALESVDVDAMRDRVAAARAAILRRMGAKEFEPAELTRPPVVAETRRASALIAPPVLQPAADTLADTIADALEELEEVSGRHVADGVSPEIADRLALETVLHRALGVRPR